MDSVSCVMAVTSAAAFCVRDDAARRRAPTNFEMNANIGTVNMDTTVSSHERMSIAIRVLMNITLLESTFETVLETTFCTPPTSFATRDWISPVRVSVKKLMDSVCRCS